MNHLGDTNKMVRREPEDAMQAAVEEPERHISGRLLAELERELNAANERIKRLEESENRMHHWLTEDCPEAVKKQLSNAWMKSKEAKP